MPEITLEELEEAFDFVSWSPDYENRVVLNRRTGKFLFHSTADGLEELDELPEDVGESSDYVEVPHKNDLDLGRRVAIDFASIHLEDPHVASRIFNAPGAYGRWKVLLEERSLLGDWFAFELEQSRDALRRWCEVNEIELEPQHAS